MAKFGDLEYGGPDLVDDGDVVAKVLARLAAAADPGDLPLDLVGQLTPAAALLRTCRDESLLRRPGLSAIDREAEAFKNALARLLCAATCAAELIGVEEETLWAMDLVAGTERLVESLPELPASLRDTAVDLMLERVIDAAAVGRVLPVEIESAERPLPKVTH